MTENTAPNFSQDSKTSLPPHGTSGPDFGRIINLAKSITLDPVGTWPQIKQRSETIREVYLNYLIYLAAVPAICGFIGQLVIGVPLPYIGTWRPSFFSALFTSLVNYGVLLVLIYVMAMIVEKLAQKFDGQISLPDAFKLVAYAITPCYLAGVLSLVPVLGFFAFFAVLYSLYVYYKGVVPMGAASEDKNMSFFFVSAGCFILTGILIVAIQIAITPTPDIPPELLKTLQSIGR